MSPPDLPQDMLAAQVTEFNKPYTLHRIPLPLPIGPNDLLIKVSVASLCHTDSMVREGLMGTPLPCTASHEGAGTVVAVGPAVTSFSLGDRVMAGILYHVCGTCGDCVGPRDYTQYCQHVKGMCGVTTDGFFAEYARIDAAQAARLPDNVSFETAVPLACAGCTVYRGVVLSGVKKGEWLGIVGSGGGLGHLGVQFAKALGLNVVGVDARDEGLEVTREAGADVVVDARGDVAAQVQKVTGGEGVHVTLNLSDAESAAATACAMTRMHGTVIQIAQPPNVSVPFHELVFRDIRLRGSLIAAPHEARDMLQLVSEHGITARTNVFTGLEKIPELIELAGSGKMRGKGVVCLG